MSGELYERLGVEETATAAEISKAFRTLAKKAHPDVGGDPDEFIALTEAYNILSSPEDRKEYDLSGKVKKETAMEIQTGIIRGLAEVLDATLASLPPGAVDMANLVAMMKEIALEAFHHADKSISDTKNNIVVLQKARKRIKRKDEKENLFLVIIDAKIQDYQKQYIEDSKKMRCLERMIEEIGDYRNIVDFIRFTQAGAYPSSSSGGFSFFSPNIVST